MASITTSVRIVDLTSPPIIGAAMRLVASELDPKPLTGTVSDWHSLAMNTVPRSYRRHRFPPEIISHAVWLYHRFCLSLRDVEDLLADPWTVRTAPVEGFSAASFSVPFAPGSVSALTPMGTFARTVSNKYRIDIESPGGSTLRLERNAALVAVETSEKAWHERVFRAMLNAGWGPVQGSIPETPDTKPAMSRLIGGHDGNLWVVRPGPGLRLPECAEFGRRAQRAPGQPLLARQHDDRRIRSGRSLPRTSRDSRGVPS